MVNASEIDRESFQDYDPEWWYDWSKPVVSLESGVRAALDAIAPIMNLTGWRERLSTKGRIVYEPYGLRHVLYDEIPFTHFLQH